ncbi:GrpB family protein [Paenibacillus sp. 2TAB23]|uniref:GrpB family protein n=1 Tax=Paenibacillus sp. 2TAB23 TaxID=3233004 RepID=UPI003F982B8C
MAVRNYLRKNADEANRYGDLKESFAKQFHRDIKAYMYGKDAFVKVLERKALR